MAGLDSTVEVTVEEEILFDPTKHAQIKTNLVGTDGRLAVLVLDCPGVLSVQDLARLPNATCLALMKEWPEMPDKVYLEVLRKIKQERSKIKEEELREEEARQETAQEEARQKAQEEGHEVLEEALKVHGVPVFGTSPAAKADSM